MNFGKALEIVKNGGMIHRTGWATASLFVFAQIPAEISVENVVPKMQSLPQSVKNEFIKRFEERHFPSIFYANQLALVDFDNHISGWSPSTSDALAEDWEVYEYAN